MFEQKTKTVFSSKTKKESICMIKNIAKQIFVTLIFNMISSTLGYANPPTATPTANPQLEPQNNVFINIVISIGISVGLGCLAV